MEHVKTFYLVYLCALAAAGALWYVGKKVSFYYRLFYSAFMRRMPTCKRYFLKTYLLLAASGLLLVVLVFSLYISYWSVGFVDARKQGILTVDSRVSGTDRVLRVGESVFSVPVHVPLVRLVGCRVIPGINLFSARGVVTETGLQAPGFNRQKTTFTNQDISAAPKMVAVAADKRFVIRLLQAVGFQCTQVVSPYFPPAGAASMRVKTTTYGYILLKGNR